MIGDQKTAFKTGLVALALAAATPLVAQAAQISSALADGRVGEQADGYLGFRDVPSDQLRDEVDAINIKRRAAYTQLATQRGVTVKDVAATVGCETLKTRVQAGRAYRLPDGIWRVKGTDPIALPDYCGTN